jgi:hypothetical protein
MKPNALLLLIALLQVPALHADETAADRIDPVEMNLIDPALLGFGPPGFSTAFTASGSMDFEKSGGSVDYFDSRTLIPLWGREIDPETFIGVMLGCGWASLDVDRTLGVDRLSLTTLECQITAAHFPEADQGWMGIGIISPGVSTDFNHLTGDDFSFSALAVWGYQFSPRFTLSAAGFFNYSIGETTAVPGIGVVWRPTDTLILQLTPPIAAIGWTPVKDWTISFSAYPAGGGWDVDREGTDGNVERIQLEGWRTGLGVERKIGQHLRISVQAGVNIGGKIELRDGSDRKLFSEDLDPSMFGMIGASYSF